MNALEITKALIACHSTTPHVGEAFDVLEGYLKELGFKVWREVFDEGNHPTENLYARLGGGSPNLCFAGHLDVVPAGDWTRWRFSPFEPTEADGYLYGRGAEDMKGAIGAFVAAVSDYVTDCHPELVSGSQSDEMPKHVRHDGFGGSISLLITGDEEGCAINGTQKMLQWLKDRGGQVDACLVGEPTNPHELGEMIKVGRRGSINSRITVHGKQGHVAYPHLADNPNSKLVRFLAALQSETLDEGTEFFPPSNLEITSIDVGNETDNLIPADASAKFNIRFNNLHDATSLESWMRGIADTHLGEDGYSLSCNCSGEAFLRRDEKMTQALLAAIEEVTGKQAALSTTGGTSDARFIKDICPVIEFGTTGSTAHHVDERVALETLEGLQRIYALFLKRYFEQV